MVGDFRMERQTDTSTGSSTIIRWHGRLPRAGWTPPTSPTYSNLAVNVTPKARKVLDGLTPPASFTCWSWTGEGLRFVTAFRVNSDHFTILTEASAYGRGPDIDKLRFGQVTIPGSVPQNSLGDGNQPAQTGVDAPLLRALGGSFFDFALTPGSSISISGGISASLSFDLDAARAQFARSFGNLLRPFFGADTSSIVLSPPPAGPGTSKYTLYHVDDTLSPPPPSLDDKDWEPGTPEPPKHGGADERILSLINSNLNRMSGQLGRILKQLQGLKGPWPTVPDTTKFMNWADLIAKSLDLAGSLLGVSGAGATLASKIADAVGDLSKINALADEIGDIIDALTDSGQDDLLEERWEKMADLLQFAGKSFTEYLSGINDSLKELAVAASSSTGSLDAEALTEVLDRYLLEPEDESPGNLFEALTTGPRLTVVARSATVYDA